MPRSPKPPPPLATEAEVAQHLAALKPGELSACRKVFRAHRLERLVSEFKLTPQQIYRLAMATRNVAGDLTHSAAPSDVRDKLGDLRKDLFAAKERVERWETAGKTDPASREALGHLNRAHVGLDSLPDDGTCPQRVVASELIKLAALLVERALEIAPPAASRRPRPQQRRDEAASVPASWRAIEWIVEALHTPQDQASRDRAAALPVQPSNRAWGAFENLAGLIFATALGLDDDMGVNPRRSIDAYLDRRRGGRAPP
jgi:hypothetical protein